MTRNAPFLPCCVAELHRVRLGLRPRWITPTPPPPKTYESRDRYQKTTFILKTFHVLERSTKKLTWIAFCQLSVSGPFEPVNDCASTEVRDLVIFKWLSKESLRYFSLLSFWSSIINQKKAWECAFSEVKCSFFNQSSFTKQRIFPWLLCVSLCLVP